MRLWLVDWFLWVLLTDFSGFDVIFVLVFVHFVVVCWGRNLLAVVNLG